MEVGWYPSYNYSVDLKGEPWLLLESTLHRSWTWAANCKFQITSSTVGLLVSSLERHLTQISITVFSESSEHSLWIAGSTMLLRATSSVVKLTCNWKKSKHCRIRNEHKFLQSPTIGTDETQIIWCRKSRYKHKSYKILCNGNGTLAHDNPSNNDFKQNYTHVIYIVLLPICFAPIKFQKTL